MKKNSFAVILIAIGGFLLAAVLSSIWSGFVLATLWGWFVASYFGVKALSIPVAIGLSGIARYATYQMPVEDKNNDPDWGKMVIYWYIVPAAFLVCGWVVQLFM